MKIRAENESLLQVEEVVASEKCQQVKQMSARKRPVSVAMRTSLLSDAILFSFIPWSS